MLSLQKCIKVYGNITIEQLINQLNTANYINIYTDGSTQYNVITKVRESGIGVYFADNDDRNISKLVDTKDNNEAEILAVIEALSMVKQTHHYVHLFTDSRLIVDAMQGISSKSKFPLFNQLDALVLGFIDVKFTYIKGHDGNEGNEKADLLSRQPFKK